MFLLAVLAVLSSACLSVGLPEYRLPENLIPQHYDLQVLANIDEAHNFTFEGTVAIQLNVIKDTKSIVLHSKDLLIVEDKISVIKLDDKKVFQVTNITHKISAEFLIIHLAESLKTGDAVELTIPFKGLLSESLLGFYRSSYTDSQTGKKVWLATTQFEATYARRAFPCLDEPALKATYTITLGRQNHHTALSNMPVEETKPIEGKDGWVWDRFEKSVPMSTYLVAYVISDFKFLESPKHKNNVTFKIWAKSDAINQTQYAAEVGPKVLSFYEDYYNEPYPLPKQDMIAIPDFSAGAMENWGIITYREKDLLYSPTTSSTTAKARVGSVIAHELAHQWFGNLVTMKWWTDLWLNEGFATYMAVLGMHHIEPEWNVLEEESVDNLMDVFKLDALENSHPVSVTIGDPSEISQIFDAISYKKGSAIIRMMNLFLGEEAFKTGVSNYLKKYRYKNAEQDDLWQCLTDVAHKTNSLPKEYTVKIIMDSWTKQTGYPLVTVTRDYSKNTAVVSQIRYQAKELSLRTINETWWVPLSYTSSMVASRSSAPSNWLTGESSKTISGMPPPDKWVLFNVDMAGVYRVNYDQKNWELLTAALSTENHNGISPINRLQLISDSFALGAVGKLPYKIVLRLLQYLDTENNFLPWKAALSGFYRLKSYLFKSPEYGTFKNYLKSMLSVQYERIGGINANLTDKLDSVKHRIQIISWACSMGVESCKKDVKILFDKWMAMENPDENNPIPKDLREKIYCDGVARGDEKQWEFMWERYKNTKVANVKTTVLSALGCTKEIWLLNRLLEESLNHNSPIRKQDAHSAFSAVSYSGVGYYVARDFLYSRINDLVKYHRGQLSTISRYVKNIAYGITSEHELKEFTLWVQDNKDNLKESSLSVKQGLESAHITLEWIRKYQGEVLESIKELVDEKKKTSN